VSEQLLLYLPVLHAGYEALLARHAGADVLLLGRSLLAGDQALAKEIRALDPERAAQYLRAVLPDGVDVRVVQEEHLPDAVTADVLVVADEQVTRAVVQRFGLEQRAEVVLERTFLRWDREWSRAQRVAGHDVTADLPEVARTFTTQAVDSASRSSDWWRQVGAVAARDGQLLVQAHNRHLPTEYAPYLNGDPRNAFSRGVEVELSTAIHAEADVVAWAAREGVSLAGADLYVSTFPCPGCARLVAAAGFARCYFAGPYAVLDGEDVLRAAGVALVWVDLSSTTTS